MPSASLGISGSGGTRPWLRNARFSWPRARSNISAAAGLTRIGLRSRWLSMGTSYLILLALSGGVDQGGALAEASGGRHQRRQIRGAVVRLWPGPGFD